jgi:hypothetical protein
MKDFIGINTRITDPMKYINKFNSVREYSFWADQVGNDPNSTPNCPTNLLRFNPSQNLASLDNYDAFYQQLANRVHPSFKWLAPEMRGLTAYSSIIQEQKPFCLSGTLGAGPIGNSLTAQQSEKYFKIGAVLRNASREDFSLTATRNHKCYVEFDNTSTYSVSLKVQFPFAANSTARYVKAWVDKNGDGLFDNSTEVVFISGQQADGGVVTLASAFNLPAVPSGDLKKYFKLRIMAISNGMPASIEANASSQETFIWDVALISGAGQNPAQIYQPLEPAAVSDKGRIVEVSINKGATTVYKKTLKNPTAFDYNYFSDGNLALMYKNVNYKFTLEDSPNSKSAKVESDLNFNGAFTAGNEIKTTNVQPGSTVSMSNAWTGTGISVVRVSHLNASSQTVGVWEYPVMVIDDNPIGSNFSSFLSNATHSVTITTNTGSTTPVNHKVVLPIEQEASLSYIDYTKWLTALSARYGAVNVCATPTSPECVFLQSMVDPNQGNGNQAAGRNHLKWLEAGNEPDKFWYDVEYRNTDEAIWQMKPKQYAALLNAVYDGANKNAAFELLPTGSNKFLGVKNMNPSMKMSMAGISDFRGKYLVDLLNQAEALRSTATKKVPFDILNIHHYTSTIVPTGAGYIDNWVWSAPDKFAYDNGSVGASPEDADLKGRYNRFYAKLFDPNLTPIPLSATVRSELADPTKTEHWITEIGYDTNNGSPLSAKLSSNSQSYYTTQAQWLVRTLLELANVKGTNDQVNFFALSKATIFEMRDEGVYGNGTGGQYSPNGSLFTHSGLLTNDFKPKRSWYHVMTMKNVLGEYRFNKDLNSGGAITFTNGGTPRIYDFRVDGANPKHILVIWSPTSNASNQKTLSLNFNSIKSLIGESSNTNLPTDLLNFTIVKPQDYSERGRYKSYATGGTPSARTLTFNTSTSFISETPIYVILNQATTDLEYANCTLPGLGITPSCDGGRVTFNPYQPPGPYRVVYAKQSDVNAILTEMNLTATCATYQDVPFDYLGDNRFKIFSDNMAVVRQFVVSGLEENTAYVLFMFYTEGSAGVTAVKPCVLCFTTNNTAPCFIDPCLFISPGLDNPSCGNFPDDYKNLLIDPVDNGCPGTVNSGPPGNDVTCANFDDPPGTQTFPSSELWNTCRNKQVEVEFQNNIWLDAINFYHGNGSDNVDIEYQCCQCASWNYLTTFRPQGQTQHWVSIVENMPEIQVKKLRFTKTGNRGPNGQTNVEIGKLHFCGTETTTCGIAGLQSSPTDKSEGIKGGIFTDVIADISDDGFVTIAWKPVPRLRDNLSMGVYDKYEAWASPQVAQPSAQFSTQAPTLVTYYRDLEQASFSAGQLTPGTYDVMIRVPKPDKGCDFAPSGDTYLQNSLYGLSDQLWADTLISFTILNKETINPLQNGNGGLKMITHENTDILVFPNPTSGRLTVAWSGTGFDRLETWSLEGRLLHSFPLELGQASLSLDLAGHAPGTYFARLSGPGTAPRQKMFVLMQ